MRQNIKQHKDSRIHLQQDQSFQYNQNIFGQNPNLSRNSSINEKFISNNRQSSQNIHNYRKKNQQKYRERRDSVKAFQKFSATFNLDDDEQNQLEQFQEQKNKYQQDSYGQGNKNPSDFIPYQNYQPVGQNQINNKLKYRPKQLQIDESPSVYNNGAMQYQDMNSQINQSFNKNEYNLLDDDQRMQRLQQENNQHGNIRAGSESIALDSEFQVSTYQIYQNKKKLQQEQKKQEPSLLQVLKQQQMQRQKQLKARQEQQLQASMLFIQQLEQQEQKQKIQLMNRKMAEQQESLKLVQMLHNQQLQQQQEEEKKIEENVICRICLMQIEFKQYDPLQACGHLFHRQCISSYLKNQIEIRKFPIACPLSDCAVDMTDWDIRQRIDAENLEKYKSYTFDNFIQKNPDIVSCCPTPDCQNVFALEQGDIELRCMLCNGHYCLACKTNWHQNMTCQQYRISANFSQDDKKFMSFVRGKNFKKCPKCKFWVERSEGCDHMTCRCGAQFCYQCGGPYRKCKCRGYKNPGDDDDDDY